ncbi:MAG: iron-containing alcohol dehydrogenase [Myxococcales bacterium]|nr:iron-containing alcohol dehydrogenase [Myxococcales bacterium]HIK84348.1 iron-containing alcohol dehydrogenase [Myxococcales bacterium]
MSDHQDKAEMLVGNFNYPASYRIGAGRIRELGSACRELGMDRPLIVTDPGILGLAWFAPIIPALEKEGLSPCVFSEIEANPASTHIEAGLAIAKEHRADGCILIGGGSAMDAGKCIALLAQNPGAILDYEDVGDNWKQADGENILPTIAVPTTAGTGSEVGRAAVIVDPAEHNKKIIFHPGMKPDLVIADPDLTLGLPPGLTAATGMDALAHCFEAYCAPGYHPMADGIALEGMRLISQNLVRAFEDGGDRSARTHLLMAASMGATAFQKGLGLIHALSHPVGGMTGLHHGTANAIFHPYVMVHNRAFIEDRMPRVGQVLDLPGERFEDVLDWTLELRSRLGLPHTLEGIVDEEMIPKLVPMAAADPSLATNPKPCSLEEIERVLRKSISGDLQP